MPLATQLTSQNPWPGLRAFTENDRDFFFGRERETAELLEVVQQSPAAVLYGQSGLGKTSLVQAGLFPALKRLNFLPLRVRFNHGDDAPSLAQQIKNCLSAELDSLGIKGPRPAPTETLWEYFHRRDLDFWGPGNRLLVPVIVLDQFEEVFTLGQRSEKASARVAQFAADLESVLEHRPPEAVRKRLDENPDGALSYDLRRQSAKFLISLREDFLASLDPWRARIPSLLSNRFRLEPMTDVQALEVVRRGGRDLVDDAVARDIVDFVSDSRRRVAPALLSVVLDELNHRRVERGESRITPEFLSGERGKIIQDFYDRSFQNIDPNVCAWVEDRLLTGGGHRQPAALEDALTEGLPEAEFDLLVDRRILHRTERDGVVWLELTHDLLTDPASRSRAEREQHEQAAEALRQREQFRRELKKSRALAAVFGVLLIGAAVALVFAVLSRKLANKREAEREVMYRSAADIANRLSADIVSNSWVPYATVEHTLVDAEDSYKKLNNPAANSSNSETYVGIPHARFMANAADALYDAGHYEEGLKLSSQAFSLLQTLGSPGSSDEMKLARAEILYEEGRGSLSAGKLNDATNNFTQALSIISSMPNWDSRLETARVSILSHIDLGQRYSDPCTLPEGMKHFQTAFDQAQALGRAVNGSPTDRDEATFLQIKALLELGSNQWDPTQGQTWYSQAEVSLQNAPKEYANDPRWETPSGELALDRANTARDLSQYDSAISLYGQAIATFGQLINRDPDNWQWQLMLARSRRGLGLTYRSLHEWDLAQSLLNQAEESAIELSNKQSTWLSAGLTHVYAHESVGAIPFLQLVESWRQSKAAQQEMVSSNKAPYYTRELDSSFQSYAEAATILKAIESSAPENFVCSLDEEEITGDQGLIRYLQAPFQSVSDQAKGQQSEKEALADYSQAIKMLAAIEQHTPQPTVEFLSTKADAYDRLADAQEDLQPQDEFDSRRKSIDAYQKLVASAPTAENYNSLSGEFISLGKEYDQEKDYAHALSQYQQAMSAIDNAIAKATADTSQPATTALQYSDKKSELYGMLSALSLNQGDLHSALDELEKALDTPLQALPRDYTNVSYLDDLDSYRTSLIAIRDALQNPDSPAPYRGLAPEQSKAFLTQANTLLEKIPQGLPPRPGVGWSLPPLLPGAWRNLAEEEPEYKAASNQLLATHKNLEGQIRGIRSLTLDFYDDAHLYEFAADGLHGTLFYVQRGKDWRPLVGSSAPIREMNRKLPPRLDTLERAVAYLRFYVGITQNEDLGAMQNKDLGRYLLVDQAAGLPWLESATPQQRSAIAAEIKPLLVEETPDLEWQARGTLEYGGNLFDASFRLSRTGIVDVPQANPIDAKLPVLVQFFSADGARVQGTMQDLFLDALKRDPSDETAAKELMEMHVNAQEYDEAENLALDGLNQNPSNDTALKSLIETYENAQEYDKAENLLLDVLKKYPANETALYHLQYIYFDLKRWNDAVQASGNWIAHLQSEPEDADRQSSLLDAYVSLSWHQIFARDFAGALASTDAAMKIDPSDLYVATNRAHALLLLGRTQEADAIYLGNRGKKMETDSDTTWDQTILKDFDDLEAAGITNPEIPRLRKLLSSNP